MRVVLQYAGWFVGIPLELAIIAAMLKGPYRRFPFLFSYTILLFLSTVVQIPVYSAHFSGARLNRTRAFYYWLSQGVLQPLILVVVIALIYRATESNASRRAIRTFLSAGVLVFTAVSFLIHYDAHAVVSSWMTPWMRDINFCAAFLDVALWVQLIAARKRDTQLLLISSALGVVFTGEAMGEALRQLWHLSRATVIAGDVTILFANLACLFIWWKTFKVPASDRVLEARPAPPLASGRH
jgi:hypothetical protein